jgi:glycine cleavage system regulatory protein
MVSTSAASAVDDAAIRERLAAFLTMEDAKVEALLTARGDQHAREHARLVTAVIHSLSVRARAGASRQELDAIADECVAVIGG